MNEYLDGVLIHRPTVDRGISEWNATFGDMEKTYAERAAKVKELQAAAPWGAGSEGQAFAQAYLKDNGPSLLLDNGTHVVGRLVEMGPGLRTAIDNHATADAASAMRGGGGASRQV
jgi:hypothetical protein